MLLIGVSDEDEKLIEETFITSLGAKYPFVKAKGCNDKYGVSGFPTVVLIGPDGIVKHFDNGTPSESMIEELLKDAILPAVVPAEPRYAPLKALWQKRDHAKVRDWIDKALAAPNTDAPMKEELEKQRADLGKRAEAAVARVEQLGKGPDYAAAQDQLEKPEKSWKGFPAADAARAQITRFSTDATVKKEVAAGKALRKFLAGFDPSRDQELKKLVVELPKFAKKWEGTYAAQQATKQATEYQKKLNR